MTVIPFDTDDEAVSIANDCPFGLGSSVFSGSTRRARGIAARLEAGRCLVWVFGVDLLSVTPLRLAAHDACY